MSSVLSVPADEAVGQIEGDPGRLRASAQSFAAGAESLSVIARDVGGSASVLSGSWSGVGATSFQGACYTRQGAAEALAGAFRETSLVMFAHAEILHDAQDRLQHARRQAEDAQHRARIAKRHLDEALQRERAAEEELAAAQNAIAAWEAAGRPAIDEHARAAAAQRAWDDARRDETRARRALEDAQHDFDRPVRKAQQAREDADRAARQIAAAYEQFAT